MQCELPLYSFQGYDTSNNMCLYDIGKCRAINSTSQFEDLNANRIITILQLSISILYPHSYCIQLILAHQSFLSTKLSLTV